MKLSFKRYFSEYGPNILARCGYRPYRPRYDEGVLSYIRQLSDTEYYPRFHVYVDVDREDEFTFTIHLDQKATSYEGTSAHAGEYDPEKSEPLRLEIARLVSIIEQMV